MEQINRIPWISGSVNTPAGEVPVVRTEMLFSDKLGTFRVRWGSGRVSYRVTPGLYAVGSPNADSPVFVSANYKLSFDKLRCALGGIDGWIMVIDTKGINVWCAAGKGTFGTDEIVRRIKAVGLEKIVSKKKLILPQLGAPGVSAHKVKEQSGFRVIYGPVKAKDIPAFMEAGNKATPEMRRVTFNVWERAVVIPNDIILNFKFLLFIAACFLLLSGFGPGIYSLDSVAAYGIPSVVIITIAYLAGMILPQLLLPYLPGRSFSAKGGWVGALTAVLIGWFLFENRILGSSFGQASWLFIVPAVTSFIAVNFTGNSTYTSLSGVIKEMKTAIPIQIASAVIGVGLWITGLFV
jgi:acetyl-CoA decarbonylase/synthase complex subunit gamma